LPFSWLKTTQRIPGEYTITVSQDTCILSGVIEKSLKITLN
jgi:hypothetical protein